MYHVFHVRAFKKVKKKKHQSLYTHVQLGEHALIFILLHFFCVGICKVIVFLFEDKNLKIYYT